MDTIIYVRWSRPEQGRGSSMKRQIEDCRRHAAMKGWNVIAELVDEGISAFTGKNARTGALARFVNDVEDGLHPNGVILLTEKLDRLSRLEPTHVVSWMTRVTDAGVVVCTVDGDRRYERGNLQVYEIIEIVVKAQVGWEESQKKSDRLAAAWRIKRDKVMDGQSIVMTRRAPAWLRVAGSPPAFQVIEDRAAIVRRIFEETAEGFGKHTIAKRLNQEGVGTFGRAAGWHSSYIQKILTSTTVLGEMQTGRKARGAPRELVGDPIQNYYPAVVDADLYARAHHSMAGRSRRVGGKGRRLVNIFSGLGRCDACQSIMTFRGKGLKLRATGEWVNEDYLVCDSYQRGRGCTNKHHYNYSLWESGILDAVLQKAIGDEHFASKRDVRALEVELAETVRRLDEAKRKGAIALDAYFEKPRPERKLALEKLETEADECEAAIISLRKRILDARGVVTPEEHQRRIHDLHAQMEDDNEDLRFAARSKVMEALHELTQVISFGPGAAAARLRTKGGDEVSMEPDPDSGPRDFTYSFTWGA
ncbi:recombinase family protein [Sphingomonas oryzagri]